MKRILMLLQSDFPPDIRLEKEIKSLSLAGFSVLVVCNQYDKDMNPKYEYCSIDRIKAPFKSKKLNKILNFPIFLNPRFIFTIWRNIVNFKPHFLHVHDLPMVPLGILFSKLFKLPVVADMHENYPAALKAFQKKGLLNFIFKNYKAAEILERFCVRRVDRLITVIEENSSRYIQMGVNPSRLFLVSNTVDLDTFGSGEIDDGICEKYKGKFILLYTGFVSPERGLETVIMGMKQLKVKLSNVMLLIVGNGISVPYLSEITEANELEKFIEFIAWPGHEKLMSFHKIANICLCPQPNNDLWNNSIPHKLFEYMSTGNPILATDAIPLKRIILETGAGLYYKTDDSNDFTKQVLTIANSNKNFSENGINAVREKYNWIHSSKILVQMYMDLLKK